MKVYVDQDLCIACGLCIDICPTVFDWNEDGNAEAIEEEVPEDVEEEAQEAMDSCPVEAIQEAD